MVYKMEEFLKKIAPKAVHCAYLESKDELAKKYAGTGSFPAGRYFANVRYLLVFAIIESFKRVFTDVEAQRLDSLQDYTLEMVKIFDSVPASSFAGTFADYEISQRVERLLMVWKDSHKGEKLTRLHSLLENVLLVTPKDLNSSKRLEKTTKSVKYQGKEFTVSIASKEEGVGDFLNLFIDSDWGGFLIDLYENPEKLKSWSAVVETPVEEYIFDEDYVAQLYLNFLDKPKMDHEYREKWIPKGKTPADRILKFLGLKKDLGGKQRFEAFKAKMAKWRSEDVQKLREFILETEE